MTLQRPTMLTLQGAPITGHTPTQLVVMQGVLTPAQTAAVQHAYRLFCLAKQAAVGDFFAADRHLPDGTRVRMQSMLGVDQVLVWAAGDDPAAEELRHGVAAAAPWAATPLHYRRMNGQWVFQSSAKQLATPPKLYNHAAIFLGGQNGRYVFRPMVHAMPGGGGDPVLWDYWRHAGAAKVPQEEWDKCLPVVLEDERSGKHTVAYATETKLYSPRGVVIHAMPDLPPPPSQGGTLARFPPCANTAGTHVALSQMRTLLSSPTLLKYQLTFGTQVLSRQAASYVPSGSKQVTEFTVPFGVDTAFASTGGVGIQEGDIDNAYTWTWLTAIPGSFGWGINTTGVPIPWPISWIASGNRWRSSDDYVPSRQGGWSARSDEEGSKDIERVVPVPGNGIELLTIRSKLNYPVVALWEGGQAAFSKGPTLPAPGYGVSVITKTRRTTNWTVRGAPEVVFMLPDNVEFKVFEGVTLGRMRGRNHSTSTEIANAYAGSDYMLGSGLHFTLPLPPSFDTPQQAVGWIAGNRIDFDAIRAEWTPGIVTQDDVEDPSIEGSYEFKSRYIIDFDHRIRFRAGIRVEASVPRASWRQTPGSYMGHMQSTGNAEHVVRVFLEWSLDGQSGERVLYERVFSAPPLGFTYTLMPNVLRWPAVDDGFHDLLMSMPPDLSPSYECYTQIKNLMQHQGVNPHFAGNDVPPPDLKPQQLSETGYEASHLRNGREYPHARLPKAFLYGRSFTLAEFPDAFWLLDLLDFNTGDPSLPIAQRTPFFYMPDFPAAAGLRRRIELEGAEARNWSDRIPAKPGQQVPALTDREVPLYYV